jgi:Putative addiction module component
MFRPIAKIQDEIRRLSAAEKEEVLRTLLEEVERRAAEIESGQVQCVPAEEVFRQLDALLTKAPPSPLRP